MKSEGINKGKITAWRKKTLTRKKFKLGAIDFIFLLAACAINAFAVVSVMIPNGLTAGALTGIVRILQYFVDLDFSVMYYVGAGIILLLSAIFLGFKEVRKIVLLSVLYPTIVFVFEKINFRLLEEKDLILAAIFCGAFMGASTGIVFWRGYAFASTEALAKILKKNIAPHYSLSKIMLAIDCTIITASAFVFDRNVALYALVSQVICAKMVDAVIYGFETKIVQLDIITRKTEKLTEYVINDLERGVSSTDVCGEYTKNHYRKLNILCSPRESILIRRFLAREDPAALVTVFRVDTVWGTGQGFHDIDNEM